MNTDWALFAQSQQSTSTLLQRVDNIKLVLQKLQFVSKLFLFKLFILSSDIKNF